eukprot:m.19886 g.19886  ORF g.19886 m.19886 type:complete len:61 (-) comp11963_c0_seq1:180-362(-)
MCSGWTLSEAYAQLIPTTTKQATATCNLVVQNMVINISNMVGADFSFGLENTTIECRGWL